MENECTSDNLVSLPFSCQKVIKIGGNLTKFSQKQFCTVLFGDTVYVKTLMLFGGFHLATVCIYLFIYLFIMKVVQKYTLCGSLCCCRVSAKDLDASMVALENSFRIQASLGDMTIYSYLYKSPHTKVTHTSCILS